MRDRIKADGTNLSVECLPPQSLKPRPNNARAHSKRQLSKLAASIAEFGFIVPVLIDAQNDIVAGHGRLEAAICLGLKSIPCIRIDHLSEPQIRAFTIADNRLSELASWDEGLLAAELKVLADFDFDVELTGFEAAEIDLVLGEKQDHDERDSKNEIPAPARCKTAVSRPGDLWLLGSHRLYCGEVEPHHVDTIVRRWQHLTKQSAIHGQSGQSFADREAAAQANSLENEGTRS
jgi:ParB/Sulfiredoxin domain